MKHFFNLKYHFDKYNYKKVADLLLYSKRGNSSNIKNEDNEEILSNINSSERKNPNKTMLQDYQGTKKNKQISFSHIFSCSNIKGGFMKTSRNNKLNKIKKEIPFLNNFTFSKKALNKLSYQDNKVNNDYKKAKSLLYEKFQLLEDDRYNLEQIYNKREMRQKKIEFTNKKIINLPKDLEELNFRKNIDMKIKMLKNIEKKKNLKKNMIKKIYYKLGEKEYENIKNIIKNRECNLNIKFEKDPFKQIENEYNNNFKRLKKEYSFYPYNYLEEHKSIDPEAFRFMVNNFNTKFSLFGNAQTLNNRYKTFYKKSDYSQKNKPSQNYIKRINRIKSKEGRIKIELNL